MNHQINLNLMIEILQDVLRFKCIPDFLSVYILPPILIILKTNVINSNFDKISWLDKKKY